MSGQIVIGSGCDSPQLTPIGEWECILNISSVIRVEGQLFRIMITET